MITTAPAGSPSVLRRPGQRLKQMTVNEYRALMGETPRCTNCGDAGFTRLPVEPWEPGFGIPQPCPCQTQAVEERRVERLADAGLSSLPRAAEARTFSTFQQNRSADSRRAYLATKAWASGQSDIWLMLTGTNGTGKTHLAYAATQYLVRRGESALYALVPDLLDRFRACFGRGEDGLFDEQFGDVLSAGWLVLDDLGAERATDWANERLYLLIDGRYRNGLPLLVTTNVGPDDLPPRIASRLRDKRICRIVDTGTEDQRPLRRVDERTGEIEDVTP